MQDISKPSWADIFVHKPVIAVIISLVLVLVGVRAALTLSVTQFPSIDSSSLIITTPYPGASAKTVQGFITEPIERVVSNIPGVDYVDSRTQSGISTVTVFLNINVDSNDALSELSTRLSQIRFELPQGAEDPSVEVIRATSAYATMYLSFEMVDGLSKSELTDYLRREIQPQFNAVKGVQRALIEGGAEPQMRIWLDPNKLAMYGVSAKDIQSALFNNNVISTLGYSKNNQQKIDLISSTNLRNAAQFERIVVKQNEDELVRLGDIADVELAGAEANTMSTMNGKEAVFISIWSLPDANEIEVSDRIRQEIDNIQGSLKHGITIDIPYDATDYMRSALREIFITLIETIVLVGIVVIAMMGSFRTAMVPLVAIPVSLLGAVAVISLMGFTLNILTILAIVLSVGLVVDDAIVVVENVSRFMRMGMSRREAALKSSRQLLSPIISMTITLATVYAPIALLTGLTGALFKEFAFTLAVAVIISGIVAITLSPIMSAYVCAEGGKESKLTQYMNGQFNRLMLIYRDFVKASIGYSKPIITSAILLVALIPLLYMLSFSELAPNENQDGLLMIADGPPEASLEYSVKHALPMVDIGLEHPYASSVWQMIYSSGAMSGIIQNDSEKRTISIQDQQMMLYSELGKLEGLNAFPVLFPPLPTAGQFDVEMVVLATASAEEMLPYAEQLKQAALETGKFMFAETDLKIDFPEIEYHLNDDFIAELGMSTADVTSQIGLYLSGGYITRFDQQGKAYRVVPMIANTHRGNPDALLNLPITTATGDIIPLGSIATIERRAAPRVLTSFEQKNSFRIYGGILPNTTKDDALKALEAKAKEILPADYRVDFAGESRQLRTEGNTLMGVLGMAMIFVFFVLAVQFNSFRDPLVILLGSVPLAIFSALVITFVDLTTINIYSQVGLITLAGLIAKNAILIVEFANQQQMLGLSKLDAIIKASEIRLRPVLMTTFATVLGHFPLVLVTGAGAAARNSIGFVLVFGMLIGTLFTLVILPSIYIALAQEHTQQEALDNA